jgi:hypothetical protein
VKEIKAEFFKLIKKMMYPFNDANMLRKYRSGKETVKISRDKKKDSIVQGSVD